MEILFAPWREGHTQSTSKTKDEKATREDCVFCLVIAEHGDEKNFVLKRYRHTVVVLNRYPYNTGHLLIVPVLHKNSLTDLATDEYYEFMQVIVTCNKILDDVIKPQGMNIGMNIGAAAGASIPAHIHMHVLPRWQRDTNFLPLIGNAKVCSIDLEALYKKLRPHF